MTRVYREQDVEKMLDSLPLNVYPIEKLAAECDVSPFEVEVPGSYDQARAFARWLKGENDTATRP